MRGRISLGVLVTTGALLTGVMAAAQPRSERLVTGEQKIVTPGYAVGDIAISNPTVCDYRVVSNRRGVMLIANEPGFATLTVWDQSGAKRDEVSIEVVSREHAKLIADLTDLVRQYPNVAVKPLGSRIVLAGTVDSQQELAAVSALASADGSILLTVTLKGAPAGWTEPPPPRPQVQPIPASPATEVPAPQPLRAPPPPAPTIVIDPAPPPSTRPVVNAPAPVSLTPPAGSSPSTPPGAPAPAGASAPSAAPIAVPAAPAPPPPNVAPAPIERGDVTVADSAMHLAEAAVEYQVDLYESPSSAPPPQVMGPQGTRLYSGRLRTSMGREVQQIITVGKSRTPATMRGLRVALTPSLSGADLETAVVVDTNLPLGPYDQAKKPVWLRSQLSFTAQSGQIRYITEAELAGSAAPTTAPAMESSTGSNAGGVVAGAAVDMGTSAVGSRAGVYIPSLGGLFSGGGGNRQPKQRPTVLLIVVTPTLGGVTPR